MNIKQLVTQFLIKNNKPELAQYLEYPSDSVMGNVALPCFVFAKELKQSPMQIAQQVVEGLKDATKAKETENELIADIVAVGPYVNFMMNWVTLGYQLNQQIANQTSKFYVVGNEQNDHFKALFEIFGKLGYGFADQCYHLSYGMIELPDGTMKSRKGNVVDADNLIEDMHAKCVELLIERHPELDEIELHRRTEIIAMAAIKMFVLKYDASKNFVFDHENSLSFDGETGPYVLYSYARAKTILSKSQIKNHKSQHGDNFEITQDARILLGMIAKFEEMIQEAAASYAPTVVAKYVLSLASQFNTYYHHTKILDESIDLTTREFRVGLVESVAEVLQNGLKLLSIETLEQM